MVWDENRAWWMKGICLKWSMGRQFSPFLPDRGRLLSDTLAHSISDPRAEISGYSSWYAAVAPRLEVVVLVFVIVMCF